MSAQGVPGMVVVQREVRAIGETTKVEIQSLNKRSDLIDHSLTNITASSNKSTSWDYAEEGCTENYKIDGVQQLTKDSVLGMLRDHPEIILINLKKINCLVS